MKTDLRVLGFEFFAYLMGLGLLGWDGSNLETRSTGENPSFTVDCQIERRLWPPSVNYDEICNAEINTDA